MDRRSVHSCLIRNRPVLEGMGLEHVSLFGSVARDEAKAGSDIDLAVSLRQNARIDLFGLAAISERLAGMLGGKVDVVIEPARNPRMQREIERDRVHVY